MLTKIILLMTSAFPLVLGAQNLVINGDAEANLDLVRALDIRRTPTVLVLDEVGRIRRRASGLPRKVDVIAALGQLD